MSGFSVNCILRDQCRKADVAGVCNKTCPSYIAIHGMTGEGGRVGAADIPADYRLLTVKSSEMVAIKKSQPKLGGVLTAYIGTFGRAFDAGGDPIRSLYLYSRSPRTEKRAEERRGGQVCG